MEEDWIDLYCNQIHVTCIGLQRLKKQQPYNQDSAFVELVERFCHKGRDLMYLIRATEGQRPSGGSINWNALS